MVVADADGVQSMVPAMEMQAEIRIGVTGKVEVVVVMPADGGGIEEVALAALVVADGISL
jgi:hypothetical protein